MKKTMFVLSAMAIAFAFTRTAVAATWKDPWTNIDWEYSINGGYVILEYLSGWSGVVGSRLDFISVPSEIYGFPVEEICSLGWNEADVTGVEIPRSVRWMNWDAFSGLSNLERIDVDPDNYCYKSVNGLLLTADGKTLVAGVNGNVVIPEGVTSIQGYAFSSRSRLTSVTMPDSVTSIEDSAFSDCTGLSHIVIPDSVKDISFRAFSGCTGLQTVTIPDGVPMIRQGTFEHCSSLAIVLIPQSVIKISDDAFRFCCSITNFVVAEANPNFISSNGLLLSKDGSTLVAGVNGDVVIPNSVTSIGDYAFHGRIGVTSMTIPDSVTHIGRYAFYGCSGIMSFSVGEDNPSYCSTNGLLLTKDGKTLIAGINGDVTIPNGVTSIQDYAFYGCSGLTNVTIPDGVASIGACAFSGCSGLTSVTIPDSVTSIGRGAFNGCNLIFTGMPPPNVSAETIRNNSVSYPQEFTAQWRQLFANIGITGNNVRLSISSKIRSDNPTIMDVVYKVLKNGSIVNANHVDNIVKVRVLAFEDGTRSFAKVIMPETFIEGTATNIGDNIEANVEHTLSWKVTADWQTRLAKMKFEVLVCDGELLPLELRTIPASDQYGRMEFSRNTISDSQVFNALLWLYADKDPGLMLSNGVLRDSNSRMLVDGTSVKTQTGNVYIGYPTYSYENQRSAPEFIFSKMGYNLLSGAVLNYVNSETRLGLSPSGVRQYAYKIVEDGE